MQTFNIKHNQWQTPTLKKSLWTLPRFPCGHSSNTPPPPPPDMQYIRASALWLWPVLLSNPLEILNDVHTTFNCFSQYSVRGSGSVAMTWSQCVTYSPCVILQSPILHTHLTSLKYVWTKSALYAVQLLLVCEVLEVGNAWTGLWSNLLKPLWCSFVFDVEIKLS